MKELRFHGNLIVTGRGSLDYLQNVRQKRVVVVTGGKSVLANGIYDRVKNILEDAGSEVFLFSGVPGNPGVEVVEAGLALMREVCPDTVIGLGGGSALDAAKAMALFYDHPAVDVETACLEGAPPNRTKTGLIAIPGTSGTAAEVTRTAVLTIKRQNIKLGVKSIGFMPDVAILDVELTLSMPPQLVAESGLDALAHAVECFLHPALDDFTEQLAAGAIEGLFRHLPLSYLTGAIADREKVHNYQCMAGCAFNNAGTIMNHGLAHSLGGRYDFGHGLLVAIGLPYVLTYNLPVRQVAEKLDYLARRINKPDFIAAVDELNASMHIPHSLKELDIDEEAFAQDIPLLVENAYRGSTLKTPRTVSKEALARILRAIYYGRKDDIC